jgi:hypothetical protein
MALSEQKCKNLFLKKIQNITSPVGDVIWEANPVQLTCCIVEPRIMMELRGVLNNIAKIYKNQAVGLVIYHGTQNETFVKEIIKGWENVILRNLNVANLQISEYSTLLTQTNFYRSFNSSHVLIFQTDSHIFSPIPPIYYTFDYIGAPWPSPYGNGCGNGGISLRNIKTMIDVSTENGVTFAEDIYFSQQNIKVCNNKTIHEQFSVETIFNPSPICCHQPYCFIKNKLKQLELLKLQMKQPRKQLKKQLQKQQLEQLKKQLQNQLQKYLTLINNIT